MKMVKIKSIRQLKAEKKRLKKRQQELEEKISRNWRDLKGELQLLNPIKNFFCKERRDEKKESEAKNENFFRNTFRYGVSLLARKFADKAEEKLEQIIKKK